MSNFFRLASYGDSINVGGAGSPVMLEAINVNTGSQTGTLHVWALGASPTSSTRKALTLNAAAAGSFQYMGARLEGGMHAELLGSVPSASNSDITITFS